MSSSFAVVAKANDSDSTNSQDNEPVLRGPNRNSLKITQPAVGSDALPNISASQEAYSGAPIIRVAGAPVHIEHEVDSPSTLKPADPSSIIRGPDTLTLNIGDATDSASALARTLEKLDTPLPRAPLGPELLTVVVERAESPVPMAQESEGLIMEKVADSVSPNHDADATLGAQQQQHHEPVESGKPSSSTSATKRTGISGGIRRLFCGCWGAP